MSEEKTSTELLNTYGARRFVITEDYEINFIDRGELVCLSYGNFKTLTDKYEQLRAELAEAKAELEKARQEINLSRSKRNEQNS